MQIVGTFDKNGITIEVLDPAGFSMEFDAYGNKERYSTEVLDPSDPDALTLPELELLCEELAEEKAYSLGLTSSAVTIEKD